MAEREKFRQGNTERLPSAQVNVPVSGQGIQALDRVAASFADLSNKLTQRVDQQKRIQAIIKGRQAGADGEVVPLDKDMSPEGIAYAESAAKAYTASLESNARKRIKELYAESFASPGDFKTKVDGYKKGVIESLDKVAPEMRQAFEENLAVWSQPYINRSFKNAADVSRETTAKEQAGLRAQIDTDINDVASDLFDSDPKTAGDAMSAISTHISSLVRVAQDQNPNMTPQQINDLVESQQRVVINQGARGWFQKQPDKQAAAVKWKEEGLKVNLVDEKGETVAVNAKDAMSKEDAAAMTRWIDDEVTFAVQDGDRAQAIVDAEQRRREAQIDKALKDVEKVSLSGYPVSAQDLHALDEMSAGTPQYAQVQAAKKSIKYVSRFANASPQAMEAELMRLDSAMRKPGTNNTPEIIDQRNKLEQLYNKARSDLQDNPMAFAESRGLMDVQPLNFGDPEQLATQLQSRIEVAYGLKNQYGATLKPFTPEETQVLSQTLAEGTPATKMQLLNSLQQAIGDQGAFAGAMSQIAPDSPVTAYAGVLMSKQQPIVQKHWFSADETITPQTTSKHLLEGEALLNPPKIEGQRDGKSKGFPMPKEVDLSDEFSARADEAFRSSPKARDTAYQAAKAVYASLSAEAGDYSGEIDNARWKRSILMATGGIGDFNGSKVVMPYGADEGEFIDQVRAKLGEAVASKAIPLTKVQAEAMELESVGDAKYFVRSGASYLLDNTGSPFMIDLSQP